MIIKKSTTDADIVTRLTTEEILRRFAGSKLKANKWDAERDRLRSFIQDHITPGRYGNFILEKKEGTPRVYATSAGNAFLQAGLAIDVGLIPKPIKGGTRVAIHNEEGILLLKGIVISNTDLFSKKPPTQITLTEIPDDPTDA